jgi:hypothetical protein
MRRHGQLAKLGRPGCSVRAVCRRLAGWLHTGVACADLVSFPLPVAIVMLAAANLCGFNDAKSNPREAGLVDGGATPRAQRWR